MDAIKNKFSEIKGSPSNTIEVKVRLPGTITPAVISFPKNAPASELLNILFRDCQLLDLSSRQLVLLATAHDSGKLIAPTDILPKNSDDDLYEVWQLPSLVRVELYTTNARASVIVDLATPLSYSISLFQRVFNLSSSDELVFQKLEKTTSDISTAKFLNSNKSLKDNGFEYDINVLVVLPSSAWGTKGGANLATLEVVKEGFLYKQSREEGERGLPQFSYGGEKKKNKKNWSKLQKRWFVLKGRFLLYYKNKEMENLLKTITRNEELTPKKVIPLEYYYAKMISTPSAGEDVPGIQLKRANGMFKGQLLQTFVFVDEPNANPQDLKSWFTTIQERCIDIGTTRIFGVDIKDLKNKRTTLSDIPIVIQNAVGYLDNFGLEVEGVFRKSGSASQIEYFKEQYDQGVEVDLKKCPDPHTIAGLLKLYLRELPEPLLTFNMYSKVVESFTPELDKKGKLELLNTWLNELPVENQMILEFLCAFLYRLGQFADINKMTFTNIATCFGTNLLHAEEEQLEYLLRDTAIVNEVCQLLIENHATLLKQKNIGAIPSKRIKAATTPTNLARPTAPPRPGAAIRASMAVTKEETDQASKPPSRPPNSGYSKKEQPALPVQSAQQPTQQIAPIVETPKTRYIQNSASPTIDDSKATRKVSVAVNKFSASKMNLEDRVKELEIKLEEERTARKSLETKLADLEKRLQSVEK